MKIMIADDHELLRDGLRHVLELSEDGIAIVEACDYPEALAMAESERNLDAVLLDLSMPGMVWSEGLTALRGLLPRDVPIIVFSALNDRRTIMQAVNLGAAGYIPKSSPRRVMLGALRLVLSGGVYLPPSLLDQQLEVGGSDQASLHISFQGVASGLTPRQREVLLLLGQGKSNKEIARTLELAEGTVKLHVTAILKALKVSNRTSAVVAASQMGAENKYRLPS
ncbi:transcriptional regulatory protein DegU [mine drainage metagenome]|uniref:Transcriptional regulatory protein DegU n=1 Tax=mine drainage metagenome TaxID=410659 RepID=A0A1J5RPI6_9ZZZZ